MGNRDIQSDLDDLEQRLSDLNRELGRERLRSLYGHQTIGEVIEGLHVRLLDLDERLGLMESQLMRQSDVLRLLAEKQGVDTQDLWTPDNRRWWLN